MDDNETMDTEEPTVTTTATTGLAPKTEPEKASSLVSDFLGNLKWVGVGAAIGFAACWILQKRKKVKTP